MALSLEPKGDESASKATATTIASSVYALMTDARVRCSTVVFFSGVVNVTVKKRLKRALHVTFSLFNYFLLCFALFLIAFIMVYCCRQLPQVYFHL